MKLSRPGFRYYHLGMPQLEHEHTSEAIARRIGSSDHNYIRDFIYGGIDGAVTTFAVVSGVSGAELSPSIVLILGFANLAADGFSMAASNFLGTRAEQDDYRRLEKIEYRHIELVPEGEREEVRQIYREKGFKGEELEKTTDLITSDKDRWVKTMLTEEYGLPPCRICPPSLRRAFHRDRTRAANQSVGRYCK